MNRQNEPSAQAWFRLVVGDPWLEADPHAAIRQQFQERYPDGEAQLLGRLESVNGVHCLAVAYLSPEAEALARELGGERVARPSWGVLVVPSSEMRP